MADEGVCEAKFVCRGWRKSLFFSFSLFVSLLPLLFASRSYQLAEEAMVVVPKERRGAIANSSCAVQPAQDFSTSHKSAKAEGRRRATTRDDSFAPSFSSLSACACFYFSFFIPSCHLTAIGYSIGHWTVPINDSEIARKTLHACQQPSACMHNRWRVKHIA